MHAARQIRLPPRSAPTPQAAPDGRLTLRRQEPGRRPEIDLVGGEEQGADGVDVGGGDGGEFGRDGGQRGGVEEVEGGELHVARWKDKNETSVLFDFLFRFFDDDSRGRREGKVGGKGGKRGKVGKREGRGGRWHGSGMEDLLP